MVGRKITTKEWARLDLAEPDILEDLATGLTMTKTREKYGCSTRIWNGWIKRKPGRAEEFEAAKMAFANTIAEETLSIADSTLDPADAQVNKVRIEARKWLAGKLAPEQWGDKSAPQVQISLQGEHLAALKSINAHEDRLPLDHSDSGE